MTDQTQTEQSDQATASDRTQHIDDVLDAVRDYWTTNPDLRLGEAITVLAESESLPHSVYFIEDDHLLGLIRQATKAE